MPSEEWKEIFKKAVNEAKKIRKNGGTNKEGKPLISYPEAVKKAWELPAIVKLVEDYRKKKKGANDVNNSDTEVEEIDGGAVKRRVTKPKPKPKTTTKLKSTKPKLKSTKPKPKPKSKTTKSTR